jgi:Protein of unknown function (DUF3592)
MAGAAIKRLYLWQTLPDGRRHISRGLWLLVWAVPAWFALVAVLLLVGAVDKTLNTRPVQGQVVRVEQSVFTNTYNGKQTISYVPVFAYQLADGTSSQGRPDTPGPNWNFEVGSKMKIRYFPNRTANIVIPGIQNWYSVEVMALVGFVTALFALYFRSLLLRWQKRGTPA